MQPNGESQHVWSGETPDWAADWLLASWVKVIERLSTDHPDFGLGVTLNLGGASYAGVLVSGRRWANDMAMMLRATSMDCDIGEMLAESFEEERQRYQRPESSRNPIRFLHLLHATLVNGHGERTSGGLPMRFRLDAISAWAIAGWAIGTTGSYPSEFAVNP